MTRVTRRPGLPGNQGCKVTRVVRRPGLPGDQGYQATRVARRPGLPGDQGYQATRVARVLHYTCSDVQSERSSGDEVGSTFIVLTFPVHTFHTFTVLSELHVTSLSSVKVSLFLLSKY